MVRINKWVDIFTQDIIDSLRSCCKVGQKNDIEIGVKLTIAYKVMVGIMINTDAM